jgi:hypothetical protein
MINDIQPTERLSRSVTGQLPGQRWNLQFKDQGYDNVLPGYGGGARWVRSFVE